MIAEGDDVWSTVDDAAHILGVPTSTAYRWAKMARRRLGSDGRLYVSWDDMCDIRQARRKAS